MIRETIACSSARIPVIWMVTHEEARAETELTAYIRTLKFEEEETKEPLCGECWIWSLTGANEGLPGWSFLPGLEGVMGECPFDLEQSSTPDRAVYAVRDFALKNEARPLIAIFRDAHAFLDPGSFDAAQFMRQLKDASKDLRVSETTIVCISPIETLPIDLRTDVTIVRPGLPSKATILNTIKDTMEENEIKISNTEIEEAAEACQGLTLIQAMDAASRSIMEKRKLDPEFIGGLKTKLLSSIPGLTYETDRPLMEEVGGLEGLKEWVEARKDGFSQESLDFGIPAPRGVTLLGCQGSGKSLFSRVLASYFKLPLISLDLGQLKAGIVGESEERTRDVFRAIEGVQRCILRVDEIEKGIPSSGDRNLDSGVSDGILQTMLTWLQERPGGAFVVFTCNNPSSLPPELLRKGRLDEIFFIDLPNQEEREAIYKVHIKKIKRDLPDREISKIAAVSEGFSGAEIEAVVIEGLRKAYRDGGRELLQEDILAAVNETIPLSITMGEQIEAIREWAKHRARPASKARLTKPIKRVEKKTTLTKRRRLSLGEIEEEEKN